MELLWLLSTEAVKSDNKESTPLSDQKQQQMKLEAYLGNTASWIPDHNKAKKERGCWRCSGLPCTRKLRLHCAVSSATASRLKTTYKP